MWELFKAELLRFRVWGIAAAVVHFIAMAAWVVPHATG